MELCSERYGFLEEYLLGVRDEPDWGTIDHHIISSTPNFPAALGINEEYFWASSNDLHESWMTTFVSSFRNPTTTSFQDNYFNSVPAVDHEIYSPFRDDDDLSEFPPPPQTHISSSTVNNNYCSHQPFGDNNICLVQNLDEFKVEAAAASDDLPTTFNMGTHSCPGQRRNNNAINAKSKAKKPNNGRPCKNLQAERRRRKRLNDRLSMLRSIVPKISKMDRTSIVGDTIAYVKELLERISKLQAQNYHLGSDQLTIFKDAMPNEIFARNSPKFEVEKRNGAGSDSDTTRIDICCGLKPGLLMSTLNTIEAELGLQIQHSVISCFNEFAMQAACCHHQEKEKLIIRSASSEEEIKKALLRNAGYAGISCTIN